MVAYPRSFAGQFVIGASEALPERADGVVHRLNDLAVVTVGDLPVARVRDADGRLIGAFLGYPLDYQRGCMLGEAVDLDRSTRDPRAWTRSSRTASTAMPGPTCSSWMTRQHRRIYLDAGGSLSAVFDPDRLLCASTTGLLLHADEYIRRFNRDLHDDLRVSDDGWFLAGLTAHHGISRLLGNHYLDLTTACSAATGRWPRCSPPRTRTRRARPSTPSSRAR